MAETQSLAFIGLGVMGFPMAGHLAAAGHRVTVFNRTPSKADAWLEAHGGQRADTPGEAAKGAAAVFACVGNEENVREITVGAQGAFESMDQGSVFVDHTTTSAMLAREIDGEARSRGLSFIDAPVSGGQAGAENGQLTIMAGGKELAFARVEPLIRCYARTARLMGPAGNGQLTKMVNQICLAGLIEGLAEGLHFAKAAGLDAASVVEVISKGAAQSWQMDNRATTMIEDSFDFGFAVDWMCKDLGICLDEASRNGAELPITALVNEYYKDVQDMGGGRWDTSSLIARLQAISQSQES